MVVVVVMVGGVGGVRVAEVAVETRVRGGGCMGGLGWGCLARRCTSSGEARYFYFGGWEGCRRWMTGLCAFAMHRVWQTARTCVTVSSETKTGSFACNVCSLQLIHPPSRAGPQASLLRTRTPEPGGDADGGVYSRVYYNTIGLKKRAEGEVRARPTPIDVREAAPCAVRLTLRVREKTEVLRREVIIRV